MNYNNLNKIFAAVVFIVTAAVYFITVQPSVSFWDCGEFIASSYLLQVPHPPGTPFFILVGRVFSMIPFVENIGLRVNAISIISSAFTILFLYLIAVKVIQYYRKKEFENIFDAMVVYTSAAIGALSLAFSDTFWFNAIEAEVYAFSTFFIAIVVWLMVKWNERADEPDNEKYLLLIAYLIGLSTGVHLMSVLAIVPVVMTIYFRKFVDDEEILKKSGILFVVHSVIILVFAVVMWMSLTETTPPSPDAYSAVDSRFVGIFAAITIVFMGIFYKKILVKNSFYLPIIMGGVALVTVYPGMVKYLPKLITTIGKNDLTLDTATFFVIIGVLFAAIFYTKKKEMHISNLIAKCVLLAVIGVTSYSMIIIRANQEPPINMNSPKTFTELESYLNREQYGDFPTFKRRYSNEPHQLKIYSEYTSDFDFFWRYQMNHMFNRYLFWNYIGRESTYQDTGVDWTDLFGIPFFLALFGLYYHFRKDWKMASVFIVMFIFLGYLTAFYQNQQQPQPRERDYFYVGAFFVFSLWIALGINGIIEILKDYFKGNSIVKPASIAILFVGVLAVPVNMINANWFQNSRANNFVPWDYAYNLLQSVEKDAILFTNGDNDTFPLWYLQDVEGVRRDVRIANLSLLNTPWYIKQLKNNEPHGAKKIEFTFSDLEIDQIGPMRWEPQTIQLPVPDEIIQKFGVTDTSVIKNKKITWVMQAGAQFGDVSALRVQDIVVLNMIQTNKWKRPIYFAVTCSDDSKLSMDDYLQMEGMAQRVVPQKNPDPSLEYINEPIMRKQLFDEPVGYNKDYQPGFKFRGLNDPNIFFDENHERLTQNYRNAFIRLAIHYLNGEKNTQKVIETLGMMEQKIPRNIISMDYRIKHDVANLYNMTGDKEKYNEFAEEVIEAAKDAIKLNPMDVSSWYNPYRLLLTHYENMGRYNDAIELLQQLKTYIPNDPGIDSLISSFRKMSGAGKPEIEK
ncbi:MAG: DUF2723 domain-containing protein [Melioribacteraceae bacterium]|nr:DUF2723 domain-containing protein [Melioribacteraceae bacterium]